MFSVFILSTLITIAFSRKGQFQGDVDENIDCTEFATNQPRCRFWRRNFCKKEIDTFDTEKCDIARYCCPRDLDAGTCESVQEPPSEFCVTGIGCGLSENDGVRRLLQQECTCAFTVESEAFCGLDIGERHCDQLESCQWTSDCSIPGAGCIKCALCGEENVCLPPCGTELDDDDDVIIITEFMTTEIEDTTETPTESPVTMSPTTATPITASPVTMSPITASPTTSEPTNEPTEESEEEDEEEEEEDEDGTPAPTRRVRSGDRTRDQDGRTAVPTLAPVRRTRTRDGDGERNRDDAASPTVQ